MRVVVRRQFLPWLLSAALVAASGCNKNNTDSSSDTGSASPTPFTVTETFTGTLTTNGAASYSFTVAGAGTVYVTLTSLSDPAGGTVPNVGLSLGTWNGTSCSVQTGIFTDNASQNASIAGQVQGAGVLCARVYDPASRITNTLSYTITVVHP